MAHLTLDEKKDLAMTIMVVIGYAGRYMVEGSWVFFDEFYVSLESLYDELHSGKRQSQRDIIERGEHFHFFESEADKEALAKEHPEYDAKRKAGELPEVFLQAGALTHRLREQEAYGTHGFHDVITDGFYNTLERANLYVSSEIDDFGRTLCLDMVEEES